MDSPFVITVYDKAFHRLGWIGAYESLTVHVRHNAVSTAELVLANDHVRLAEVLADGARIVIDYEGATLLSGPVTTSSGQLAPGGTVTVTVESDWRIIRSLLGWPVPANELTAQTKRYDRRRGPAETVAKQLISANAARLGIPLDVEDDGGRGSVITVSARMHPLIDRLLPAVDVAGVGIRMQQSGTQLRLSCYVPRVRERVLTQESGVIVTGDWTTVAPTVSNVVAGGYGEGVAREFFSASDAGARTEFGPSLYAETFIDADDAASDWTQARNDLKQAQVDLVQADRDVREARRNLGRAQRALQIATSHHNAHNTTESAAAKNDAQKDVTEAQTEFSEAVTARNATVVARDRARSDVIATRAEYETEVAERMRAALIEGRRSARLRLELAETATFRYRRTVTEGDVVTVQTSPRGPLLTDVVREVTLSHTRDEGVVITPIAGDGEGLTSPDRLIARAIARLARASRRNVQ